MIWLLLIAVIVIALGGGIKLHDSLRSCIILDTTKIQSLYKKDLKLFDITTGDFFYRIYNNYDYYYYPPLSSRIFSFL
jgi:hypothetical protein